MDNYPEQEDLDEIKTWAPEKGFHELLEVVKSIWWTPEWGFSRRGNRYDISTGGWSGNEEIIEAMQENFIFWSMCWVSTRRGGHYVFKVPRLKQKKPLATSQTVKQ